jgi:aminopeptidase N
VRQSCDPTADGSTKEPFFFPFTVGLVGPDGKDLPATLEEGSLVRQEGQSFILQIANEKETFLWSGVTAKPVCSVNRDFTAPIKVDAPYTEEESVFLMAHDPDNFNRWDAGRELGIHLLLKAASSGNEQLDPGYSKAFAHVLQDSEIDPSLKALALCLPAEATLAQRQDPITFDANRSAKEAWMRQLAEEHRTLLLEQYKKHQVTGPYSFDPDSVGRRKVANTCLAYLARLEDQEIIELCRSQYHGADNMTGALVPMQLLCHIDCPEREEVLSDFYSKWKDDPLVMCKWFGAQAASRLPDTLDRVLALTKDPAYTTKIPNLIRALWGTFQANEALFHRIDGSGYKALADTIIELDPHNPMIAAGLSQAFRRCRQLDEQRQKLTKEQLERILAVDGLSNNTYEIVSKTLESAAREEVSL